jgi:nitrate reductase gamma subunit
VKGTILFEISPYAALTVLAIVLLVRFVTARRSTHLDRERAGARELFRGGRFWRGALVALLLAHLAGLLVPQSILRWNSVVFRLYLLEGTGFLLATAAVGGCLTVIRRHFLRADASKRVSVADSLFLAVLLLSIVSGLLSAVLYRWGSNWGTATVTPYVHSIIQGHPSARLVRRLPFLMQLHIFSAFAVVALVPFTGLSLSVVAALCRVSAVLEGLRAIGSRKVESWLRRHNPARWLWPEED